MQPLSRSYSCSTEPSSSRSCWSRPSVGAGTSTEERSRQVTETLGLDGHRAACERLRGSYGRIPAGQPVRLAKRTSNLFRAAGAAWTSRAWTSASSTTSCRSTPSALDRPGAGDDDLRASSSTRRSRHGLMPLVVPQLRTITLGGAVTGLGIESSSFRNGLPHESVLRDGDPHRRRRGRRGPPDGEHADLFRAFPNSYGSLGYALRLRDRAGAGAAASSRCGTCGSTTSTTLHGAIARRSWRAAAARTASDVDFVDGVVFSRRARPT